MNRRVSKARAAACAVVVDWKARPTEHPSYVLREALSKPLKHSGWCRPKAMGARLSASSAVMAVRVAGVPHTYRDKDCLDPLVPEWVAVVFAVYKGEPGERLAVKLELVKKLGGEGPAAVAALAQTAGLDAVREFIERWRP